MNSIITTMGSENTSSSWITTTINYFTLERMIWTLIGVGFFVYANSLVNGFVMDDQGLILNNQNIHVFNMGNFFRGSMFDYGGSLGGVYYRPLQSVLFSGIYTIFGEGAFFYHVIQMFLHITNSILVLLFLRKYLHEKVAFVLSLLFLIHPISVEAVSYIASMQDVLFFFFGLLYLLFLRKFFTIQYKTIFPYLFLLCSLLSKESGILFLPLGMLFIFLYHRKGVFPHGVFHMSVFGIYCFFRVFVAGIGISSTSEFIMMRLPLTERLMNIPAMLWYYLKTFFLPIDLIAVQSWVITQIQWQGFFLPLFLVVSVFLVFSYGLYSAFKKTHEYRMILFFSVWLGIGLLMHMQISPLDVTVADRYFYFPMVGLLGLLGIYIQRVHMVHIQKFSRGVFFGVLCISILLAGRTILRNMDWKDTKTLALHDLSVQPDNYQLLSGLGAVYLGEKDYTRAIYYLRKSVDLYPYWGTSQYNLAVSYHMSGQTEKAKKYYISTIKNAPFYISAYENMAILLYYKESPEKARVYTRENLKKFPYSVKMWHVLALSEYKLGHQKESSEAAKMYYMLSASK